MRKRKLRSRDPFTHAFRHAAMKNPFNPYGKPGMFENAFNQVGYLGKTDLDNDKVLDYKDCRPFDPFKHMVEFKAPTYDYKFRRGGQELTVSAKPVKIPRNAILIRPNNPSIAPKLYEALEKFWRSGGFANNPWLVHGSVQQFINTRWLKKELPFLENIARITVIDNVEGYPFQPGDIVLTRHGVRTAGLPYLITEE